MASDRKNDDNNDGEKKVSYSDSLHYFDRMYVHAICALMAVCFIITVVELIGMERRRNDAQYDRNHPNFTEHEVRVYNAIRMNAQSHFESGDYMQAQKIMDGAVEQARNVAAKLPTRDQDRRKAWISIGGRQKIDDIDPEYLYLVHDHKELQELLRVEREMEASFSLDDVRIPHVNLDNSCSSPELELTRKELTEAEQTLAEAERIMSEAKKNLEAAIVQKKNIHARFDTFAMHISNR